MEELTEDHARLLGYQAGVRQFLTGKSERCPFPASLDARGHPHPDTPLGNAWYAAWAEVCAVYLARPSNINHTPSRPAKEATTPL